jgi:hypothetical protein
MPNSSRCQDFPPGATIGKMVGTSPQFEKNEAPNWGDLVMICSTLPWINRSRRLGLDRMERSARRRSASSVLA